jgi:hypothetical protein
MHLLHILGSNITLGSPVTGSTPEALLFGIAKRPQPFTLAITLSSAGSEQAHGNLESILVPAMNPKDLANGRALSCRVKIPNGNQLSQVHIHLSQGQPGLQAEPFLLLEPVWLMRPAPATLKAHSAATLENELPIYYPGPDAYQEGGSRQRIPFMRKPIVF